MMLVLPTPCEPRKINFVSRAEYGRIVLDSRLAFVAMLGEAVWIALTGLVIAGATAEEYRGILMNDSGRVGWGDRLALVGRVSASVYCWHSCILVLRCSSVG